MKKIIGAKTTKIEEILNNLSFAQIANLAGHEHKITFENNECENNGKTFCYRAQYNEIINGEVIRENCKIIIEPYIVCDYECEEPTIMLSTKIEIKGK